MTQRGLRLLERPEAQVEAALRHPNQLRTCALVRSLLDDLALCHKPIDYYEFQGSLFHELHGLQLRAGGIRRAMKRQRSGRPVDRADLDATTDLELELLVTDRCIRQFHAVGDALAWRVFNYDRRVIVALSRNARSGPMAGKEGLPYELGAVVEAWEERGNFCLLHDLTTVLRIGDLSEFAEERTWIREIKSSPSGARSAQTRRAEHAVAVLRGAAPLLSADEAGALFQASAQMKTAVRSLGAIIRQAREDGYCARRIGGSRVVGCLALTSGALPEDPWLAIGGYRQLIERALTKLVPHQHRFRATSLDSLSRDPTLAPIAIYPLSTDDRADLICDLIAFDSLLTDTGLTRALESTGFSVITRVRAEHDAPDPSEPVITATMRDRAVTIHGASVAQLLLEFVDLDRWALGLRELMVAAIEEPHAVLTFSNERACWR